MMERVLAELDRQIEDMDVQRRDFQDSRDRQKDALTKEENEASKISFTELIYTVLSTSLILF